MAEAAAAFDRLIAEKPDDDGLRMWKALTLLEQAREIKDNNASGYKPLVMNAYAILQPLKPRLATNADWNFAMAKAFWLNASPDLGESGRGERTPPAGELSGSAAAPGRPGL